MQYGKLSQDEENSYDDAKPCDGESLDGVSEHSLRDTTHHTLRDITLLYMHPSGKQSQTKQLWTFKKR